MEQPQLWPATVSSADINRVITARLHAAHRTSRRRDGQTDTATCTWCLVADTAAHSLEMQVTPTARYYPQNYIACLCDADYLAMTDTFREPAWSCKVVIRLKFSLTTQPTEQRSGNYSLGLQVKVTTSEHRTQSE